MGLYVDEEDVWKCPQHPSRRRRTGICHVCLRERLSSLCPDCANVRPCTCAAAAVTTSSSSSSSSSYSRFSSSAAATTEGIGAVGRVSNLIEREPAFRRSRSLAVPFLRSKPAVDDSYSVNKDNLMKPKGASFWSLFKSTNNSSSNSNNGSKSKRIEFLRNGVVLELNDDLVAKNSDDERRKMMRKSRSVAVRSDSVGSAEVSRSSAKGRGWHFPSPIKVFRQSISLRGMVHERSPLYRG